MTPCNMRSCSHLDLQCLVCVRLARQNDNLTHVARSLSLRSTLALALRPRLMQVRHALQVSPDKWVQLHGPASNYLAISPQPKCLFVHSRVRPRTIESLFETSGGREILKDRALVVTSDFLPADAQAALAVRPRTRQARSYVCAIPTFPDVTSLCRQCDGEHPSVRIAPRQRPQFLTSSSPHAHVPLHYSSLEVEQ